MISEVSTDVYYGYRFRLVSFRDAKIFLKKLMERC